MQQNLSTINMTYGSYTFRVHKKVYNNFESYFVKLKYFDKITYHDDIRKDFFI